MWTVNLCFVFYNTNVLFFEIKYVILVECLTVSATGHLRLKKNLGKKQSKNESTFTNITKASDIHILALCSRCISNCVYVYGEAIICQAI